MKNVNILALIITTIICIASYRVSIYIKNQPTDGGAVWGQSTQRDPKREEEQQKREALLRAGAKKEAKEAINLILVSASRPKGYGESEISEWRAYSGKLSIYEKLLTGNDSEIIKATSYKLHRVGSVQEFSVIINNDPDDRRKLKQELSDAYDEAMESLKNAAAALR